MDRPIEFLRRAAGEHSSRERPFVTLSYAQSLDGSLSRRRGEATALSSEQSLRLTHALRAEHDAILVGRGTVESDDPQLTVRLAAGPSPRPVILDSRLNCPADRRVFQHPKGPWLVTGNELEEERARAMEEAGGTVLRAALDADGRVSLGAALARLAERGVGRLMVEGGARVISSFVRQRAADILVLTIAPLWLGGLRAVEEPTGAHAPRLEEMQVERYGQDLVVWGRID
jgi:3,4-dihydroxy 2-butanone 4-phosphate synthase/GTP cyclohydrolase II